jgi:hypothetical protein
MAPQILQIIQLITQSKTKRIVVWINAVWMIAANGGSSIVHFRYQVKAQLRTIY